MPRGEHAHEAYCVSTMERMLLLLAPASVLMVRPKPSVVVRRDGLERAVHAECGLGQRPPVPVFPFSPPKRRGGQTGPSH